MSSGTPYIGSKISLVSKAEIRYEGFLYTIDQNDSTVTLAKVISLGTEDRVPGAGAVPAREEVFEYIVFRGADIKDLHVCEGPKKVEDPAIVTHSYSSQSYNPNYHRGPPPFPPQGGGPGMNFGYNPFNMPPPNNNNAPVDHHNAQHNNRQQSPSPRHDQQQQQQRGGGGGGGKSGGFQDNRKPKESGKYRDDGYTRENRENTGNKQGKEKESSRRDHEGHDNRDNRDDNRAPRHNRDNNNRDNNSNRDNNNRDNRSRGRRDEEGDDNDSKTRDNRYRDNRREYRDNNNRDNNNRDNNNRDNNNRDNNSRDNRRDNRDSYHQRGERGEGRTKHEDRDDQRSATGSESGRGQARGGVRGGARGANRGTGRGGRGAPRGGGGGGGGEGAAPTTTTATRNKFTEDFDFQTSNAKFNKEEIEKELLKVLKKVKIKDEDGTEEIKDMEERESDERAPLPSPDKFYDRSKSFFDNILCEAMPPRNEEEVMTRRQEQALNTETFGSSATHYRPPYRGRGRGRGRWRGGRGFHRGRGNFRGNQGNNNRRWVDYEFDYEAAGIKNKSQPKATTED